MRNFIIAIMVFASVITSAQSKYSLILQSGNYTLPEGDNYKNFEPVKGEVFQNRIYRIVQFYNIPDQSEIEELKSSGIRFLHYLPKNAYIVSVPSNYSLPVSFIEEVRSVSRLTPQMKYQKMIADGNIPDYAIDGRNYKLNLIYYEDLSRKAIYDALLPFEQSGDISNVKIFDYEIIELTTDPSNIEALASLPFVYFVQPIEDPGSPENFKAVTSHRVNAISNGVNGYNLDGSGIVVSHGDDGTIGPHIDFEGRLTQRTTTSGGTHGDHVAGTIFGAGNLEPDGRGMAPGAEIIYYSYPGNLNNVTSDYANDDVRITSSSYSSGCNSYTNDTRVKDKNMRDMPHLVHVFSAGNNNGANCGYGAGTSWGNITGGHKQGKNVIAVANLTSSDAIASSSSRGPASDGRIKPDVGGLGTSVYSTMPNNTYGYKTGTSMSCPGIAGTSALLYEHYKNEYSGDEPFGGLIKAILMNTAEDIGNPGPDFIYGYGRVNALRAVELIEDQNIIIDSISNNGVNTHTINVPSGVKELRVMLFWTDKEGVPNAARALVNDLDFVVTETSSSTSYLPWVLDPTPNSINLTQNAVRAVDSLNNAEQITLSNPDSGDFSLEVTGSNIVFGPQQYFIVYSYVMENIRITAPFGGEKITPNDNYTVRWETTGGSGNFSVEYSTDNGSTWSNVVSGFPSTLKQYNWNIPNSVATNEALVRVSRGGDTSVSEPFTIIGAPNGINVVFACPDSLGLSWNNVSGATGYYVHRLGQKYMDIIASTDTNFVVIKNMNPNFEYWHSISSIGPDSVTGGIRSKAVKKQAGITNCTMSSDASLAITSPGNGTFPSCLNLSAIPIEIEITNMSAATYDSVEVYYILNGGAIQSEVISSSLGQGGVINHTFSGSINLPMGINELKVWMYAHGDQNGYNDTAISFVNVVTGTMDSLVFVEDFDSFSSCTTASNCTLGTCNLSNGWYNEVNGVSDDIDFRTNGGTTPSNGTGPTSDNTSGNGRYLYLEASSCFQSTAILLSPCIDLDTISNPEMSFYYHMNGTAMGELHLDIIVNGSIIEDITPAISGNQGNLWIKRTVDLSSYANNVVVLRFRGITGSNWQSDIAIDDINVYNSAVQAPVANFTSSIASDICIGDTVVYTSTTSGIVDNYQWNFGNGATPSSASTMGPHSVVYSTQTIAQVDLVVSNQGGNSSSQSSFLIVDKPESAFIYNLNNLTSADFTDQTLNNPTSWYWDFGDGSQTSSLQNPNHVYTNFGTYSVLLVTTNDCGVDSIYQMVYISNVSIEEDDLNRLVTLSPNPARSNVTLSWSGDFNREFEVRILNSIGQELVVSQWNTMSDNISFDISNWEDGVYFIDLVNQSDHHIMRWIKQ